ncbi:MAG TPA: zinc ribbon domain-containing protein [Bryocella sp.]|nr:zinc ribbon domain-containing protein [Bryocella sp.]
MPLYEYECKECGRRTEKIQKFSDPELTVCPHCGGAVERTLTAPAVQFKGGGWYKDLYSSPKPAASSSADAARSGGEGSKPTESAAPAGSVAPSSASSSESSTKSATPTATASTSATASKS